MSLQLAYDEGSSSHEQPLAAADNTRVTRGATIEDLITCGRQLGKLQLHKPGDLRITRPHAAGNPFTKRLACTSGDCHSRNSFGSHCDACREAVCEGYEQLASEQTDVTGHETTVREIGIARGLAVHTDYAELDASTLRSALLECATAINAGQPIRLLCGCPMNMRCHRDAAASHRAITVTSCHSETTLAQTWWMSLILARWCASD